MNLNYEMWRYLMLINSKKNTTTPKMYGIYLKEKKHKRKRKR